MTIQEVGRVARETVIRQGDLIPMVVVEGSQRATGSAVQDLPGTAAERRKVLREAGEAMAQTAVIGQLVRVFFVCLGWMSRPEAGKPPTIPPSQDPNRTEVLVVSGADLVEHTVDVLIYELVRDDDGLLVAVQEVPNLEGAQASASPLASFIEGFLGQQSKAAA